MKYHYKIHGSLRKYIFKTKHYQVHQKRCEVSPAENFATADSIQLSWRCISNVM